MLFRQLRGNIHFSPAYSDFQSYSLIILCLKNSHKTTDWPLGGDSAHEYLPALPHSCTKDNRCAGEYVEESLLVEKHVLIKCLCHCSCMYVWYFVFLGWDMSISCRRQLIPCVMRCRLCKCIKWLYCF